MKLSTRFSVALVLLLTTLLRPLASFGQYGPSEYVLSTQAQVDAFDPAVLEGRTLVVSGNDITNVNGLSDLVGVTSLWIENNPNLVSLAPLNNLDSVINELRIAGNGALTNLDGFTSLKGVGQLTITNNLSLASISGFPALTEMYWSGGGLRPMEIDNNPQLMAITGFNAIRRIYVMSVSGNAKLTTISGFQSLSLIVGIGGRLTGGMTINDNPQLMNIDGFLSLQNVDHLNFSNNVSITNIDGFASLTRIGYNSINISGNTNLENFDGLTNAYKSEGNNVFFFANLSNNPMVTNPCGIFNVVSGLPPFETGGGRIAVDGSGFRLYQLLSCGQTSNIIPPAPLVQLSFNQPQNVAPANSGTLIAPFVRSAGTPVSSTNVPNDAGGSHSFDFGNTPGNFFVESTTPIDGLKNLDAFTITGWLNSKSNVTGSGGNRVVSWINNGGEGVDLVYQSNGSLRLGVDGWPDFSPAFSNPNKVTTNASGSNSNWTFFAVTYQSNGQVQFYFGNNTTDATLDVTRTYSGPGVTGANIGKLAIGAFNDATRNSNTWNRMFRGAIDDIQVYNSVLNYEKILSIQHNVAQPKETTPPTAPGNLRITAFTASTVTVNWEPSTDNVGVIGYRVGGGTIATDTLLAPTTTTYTFQFTPEPGRNHIFTVAAIDEAQNGASSYVSFREAEVSPALVRLGFNEFNGNPVSDGTAPATFVRSSNSPMPSTNTPVAVGGPNSLDFGTTAGNNFVQSNAPLESLKNLTTFTLTGWVNNRSNVVGSGGNRIISWINNGGDGVDLVYQNNGSLRLGVDGWPDNSPAFSSSAKIPTNASAPADNWTFFAVTYSVISGSNAEVKFYFGNNVNDATLDVTKTYVGPGITGANIGKLAIGAFNDATRNANTWDRMFRGLIDDVQIHGAALGLSNIIAIQHGFPIMQDTTPPSAPSNLALYGTSPDFFTIGWDKSIDNVGVTRYLIMVNQVEYDIPAINPPGIEQYTHTGVTGGTTYTVSVRARDAAGNISAPSQSLVVSIPMVQQALVNLPLDEAAGVQPVNTGYLLEQFSRSVPAPYSSTSAAKGSGSFDFGVAAGNNYVESNNVINGLTGLTAFTLTGWVNCNSSTTGSGGNRIVSWINNGGDGVDLVYQSNGSLRLGVDGWPDFSPAFSSPNKVTTVAPTQTQQLPANWVFFAVTYRSNGQVQFYFGNQNNDASLDVIRSYTTPGVTGNNIGKLSIGNFNSATRGPSTYDRMFRGSIDDIRIYNSVLDLPQIISVQGRTGTTNLNARLNQGDLEELVTEDVELKNELFQNYPNPFSSDTEVGVSLLPSVRVARVTVKDVSGRELKNVVINERGTTSVQVNGTDLNAGMYFYSLIVDGNVVDIKRMVLTH